MKPFLRTFVTVVGAVMVLAAATADSEAFDGMRKGFVLGGGIGGGTTSLDQSVSGASSGDLASVTEGTFVTDFRIGGAFNEHWMLYYDNQVWWGSTDFTTGNEGFMVGIGLVGLSYYFTAEAPSLYAVGTVGVSSFGPSDDYTAQTGFGISGGVGYEFKTHWSIEAVLGWGNPEEDALGSTLTTDVFAWSIRIHGLAY